MKPSAHRKRKRSVAIVHIDRGAVRHLALEDEVGERILQIFLHGPLQRPRAIDRIIADPPEPGAGRVGQRQRDFTVREQLCHAGDLKVNNRAHMLHPKAGETG